MTIANSNSRNAPKGYRLAQINSLVRNPRRFCTTVNVLVSAIFVLILTVGYSVAEETLGPANIQAQAKQFRSELLDYYGGLAKAGHLKPGPIEGDVVSRFIPVGSKLGDARELLRDAGFFILKIPEHPTPQNAPYTIRPGDRSSIFASMVADRTIVSVVRIKIAVTPDDPTSAHPLVKAIDATIDISTL